LQLEDKNVMSTKAVAFLATAKPTECRQFYSEVLGLTFIEETAFALLFDAFGTPLRVQKVEHVVVAPYTAFGLEVDNIIAAVDALVSKGVHGERYAHFEQDARAIWTAPSGARVFWFQDPDAHLISLTQI
jgi:catechol 2,3-dioxygenase-like lactoylglutathione lyase family enzyme